MQESLEALKDYSIISSDEIQALRHFVLKNNPDLTEAQRAQLFAKCLHQKLDEALSIFDISLQKNIKRCLIQKTVSKADFSINALDIVETYTQVEPINASNIHLLTSWVNQQAITPLTEDTLLSLAHVLVDGEPLTLELPLPEESSTVEPTTISQEPALHSTPLAHLSTSSLTHLKRPISFCLLTTCFLLLTYTFYMHTFEAKQEHFTNFSQVDIAFSLPLTIGQSANYLQEHLQYKTIDETALKTWLINRNSILANDPYFSSIINTAQSFNINPLLIFAITGQEQNFVPATHPNAAEIANNPFNLYGSWQDYNTSITDSTRIVAHTIIRLGKDCPNDQDQIKWINKRYAADPNWHKGVTYFFNELEAAVTHSS